MPDSFLADESECDVTATSRQGGSGGRREEGEEIVWSEKTPFQLELTESPIQRSEFKIKIWPGPGPPVLLQTYLT